MNNTSSYNEQLSAAFSVTRDSRADSVGLVSVKRENVGAHFPPDLAIIILCLSYLSEIMETVICETSQII